MPIRTNRGRAAVYRRLWGWPMRSPAHLAGTLVVLAVLITGAGIVVPKLLGTDSSSAAASTPADSAVTESSWAGASPGGETATSSLPTRLTEPLVTPSPVPPDPDALQVAGKWVQAWVHHPEGITSEAWLDGLEPYTTREFLPVMASVDPANIPSEEVTGEPSALSSYAKSVVAMVPTDGPDLQVTVVDTDYGWRVAHYERAR